MKCSMTGQEKGDLLIQLTTYFFSSEYTYMITFSLVGFFQKVSHHQVIYSQGHHQHHILQITYLHLVINHHKWERLLLQPHLKTHPKCHNNLPHHSLITSQRQPRPLPRLLRHGHLRLMQVSRILLSSNTY